MKKQVTFVVTLCVAVMVAGCAAMKPVSAIDSSAKLGSNERLEVKRPSDTIVYKDNSVDYQKYRRFLLAPVEIYKGEDNDFGSIPEQDRQMMADFIQKTFIETMRGNNGYELVKTVGPDVMTVKLTLIGITRTTRSLQAITMLNPIGLGVNSIKSVTGGEGTFMGNVTISGEFYDSESNRLLSAFQAKRYPLPIDIIDLNGEYDAAQTGVKELMLAIRKGADATHGKSPVSGK